MRRYYPAFLAVWAAPFLFDGIQAQTLPPPDAQGWIKIFRGTQDAANFYSYYGEVPPARAKGAFPDDVFRIKGDTIDVFGSPTGHLVYRIPFSHYKVRYQMRFPGNTVNCGMLLHIQENDPILFNEFPRSVEAQGDPGQGMGQLWAIGDVWVTVTTQGTSNGNPRYSPTGTDLVYGAANSNSRCVTGKDGWGQPSYSVLANQGGGWVTQEASVYGRDSIVIRVADTVRIKYRLPRVSTGGNPNNVTKYLDKGFIAWQSEGRSNNPTAVFYRNLQVMLLPGDSLYATTALEYQKRYGLRQSAAPEKLVLGSRQVGFRGGPRLEAFYNVQGRELRSLKHEPSQYIDMPLIRIHNPR